MVLVTTTDDVSVDVTGAAVEVEAVEAAIDSEEDVPEEAALVSEREEVGATVVVAAWEVSVTAWVVVCTTVVVAALVGVVWVADVVGAEEALDDEVGSDELLAVTVATVEDDRTVVAAVVTLVAVVVALSVCRLPSCPRAWEEKRSNSSRRSLPPSSEDNLEGWLSMAACSALPASS